ncbi:hypothetical protein BDW22DRAFT_918739 [Trametopsis cervina]|nr:hypothetical protein BDW22DRAFT_918739 [Trametopsis cervina]
MSLNFSSPGLSYYVNSAGRSARPTQNLEEAHIKAPRPRLRALVIGISSYNNAAQLPDLRGAIADASRVERYLIETLGVSPSHITCLRDHTATRVAILTALTELATDPEIPPNNPIVVYFAGYGGTTKDPEAENGEVECLLPYDYNSIVKDGQKAHGIPSYIFLNIVERIAAAKGHNITIILDCCFATCTSDDRLCSSDIGRGVSTLDPLPAHCDSAYKTPVGQKSYDRFFNDTAESHVMIVSSSGNGFSVERGGRGIFTDALLYTLETLNVHEVTYAHLLASLPDIATAQQPRCSPLGKDRLLFLAQAPNRIEAMHSVFRTAEGWEMKAGAMHGVTPGTILDIFTSKDKATPLLCSAVVSEVSEFTSTVTLSQKSNLSVQSWPIYARQFHSVPKAVLRLHLDPCRLAANDLHGLEVLAPGKVISVSDSEQGDVSLAVENNQVVFELLSSAVNKYGVFRIPYSTDIPNASAVLSSAANWFHHFRIQGGGVVPLHQTSIKFTQLIVDNDQYDDWLRPLLVPQGPNLFVDGKVDMVVNSDQIYGMEIANTSDVPMYISVFFFDSDFSVLSYYQPSMEHHKSNSPVPVNAHSSIVIGYGDNQVPPFAYRLQDGLDLDVGFAKIFFSPEYVDLSHFVQPSPFEEDFDRSPSHTSFVPQPAALDCITFPIIQRRG